jgi:hypothetical protein
MRSYRANTVAPGLGLEQVAQTPVTMSSVLIGVNRWAAAVCLAMVWMSSAGR